MSDDLRQEYSALTSAAGFVALGDRCFLRLTGSDRQAFFHNFCTNDIKQLEPGQVCEAFVLNSKGKILGFVHAIATDEELLLTGHGDQSGTLMAHLDMYLIREDVEMTDVSQELAAVFVCGDQASDVLAAIGVKIPPKNGSREIQLGETQVRIAHIELAGFGELIVCPQAKLERVITTLDDAGVVACSMNALHMVRVERKTPWFGIDVDDSNLPQELQRDEKAINFNKGCYLGQETVARIDARGRVNQLLVGLEFADDPPSVGDELVHAEKSAGRVTSVVESSRDGSHLGLGYVKRSFKEPGSKLKNAIVLG